MESRLTRISDIFSVDGRRFAFYRCRCGVEKKLRASHVEAGTPASCGCLQKETTARVKTTHGHCIGGKKSGAFTSWRAMVERATNPGNKAFQNYGARGITVCHRWLTFSNFLADMGDRPQGMSLERVDNNAGYSPENCRWATRAEQARNQRSNRLFEINGVTKCLTDWVATYGQTLARVNHRLKSGWDIVRALETPAFRHLSL